jgi:hypothetical protein
LWTVTACWTDLKDAAIMRAPALLSLKRWRFLPGVTQGLHGICVVEILVVVATNQPDVACGLQRRGAVEAVNAPLLARMPAIIILVCYEECYVCLRRKPNLVRLLEAAEI